MKHATLRSAIVIAAVTVFGPSAMAISILSTDDFIIGIDVDPPSSNSSYPGGEPPSNVVDGTLNKYLNFAGAGSGFIVDTAGSSTVQSFQITAANDESGRDPTSWEVWGTNDAITSLDNSTGLAESWTLLDSGDLALDPFARNTPGPVIAVDNSDSYGAYKMIFPTNAGLPQMQIAEAAFFPASDGSGANIFSPVDPTLAVHFGPTSNFPGDQTPFNVLDSNPATKYLNFGKENTGFIVTPDAGASTINGFRLTTADDAVERDPASWRIWGTNDPISTQQNGLADGENWTLIDSGGIALTDDRLTVGDIISVDNQQGSFTSYRMDFPTLKNSGLANSMQIGDVEFFAPDLATLLVNRATGEVQIRAEQDITIDSYELLSQLAGGIDDSNWSSISSTAADPDDTWGETSVPGNGVNLAESDIPSNGADNGFTLTAGSTYSLGNVWSQLPTIGEDLEIDLRDQAGDRILALVEYSGTEIIPGDYNNDGSVTIDDWPTFLAGYGGDFTGMTLAQAYFLGDLDQDLDSDLNDFKLFVAAAGGAAALFSAVPEPSAAILFVLGFLFAGGKSRSRGGALCLAALLGVGMSLNATTAQAQSFTNIGGAPNSATIPAGQMNEGADTGPINFFDDDFLDDPGAINDELFLLDYNDPNLQGGPFKQYSGQGAEQKTVFFDYGSSVSANWFAYSQRSGADATADRVGQFEFWFSNTDFNDVIPVSDPDSIVKILPTDARLRDSALRPYTLSGTQTGRYVAMRLTASALSADQASTNIGGHEFRLLSGPTDVVLEVDRATGDLTLKNNLAGSISIPMKSYAIESPSGALDAGGFNGVGGDSGAFPLGNGTGNGWEIGGASHANRLVEGNFSGFSTLGAGEAGLSLGSAYNALSLVEDLVFTWSNDDGNTFNARVAYVGTAPDILPGDYNDDGTVDAADYTVWRDNEGTSAVLPNDQTPGAVDQSDYTAWQSNYGNSSSAVANAVPEPTGVCLLLIGVVVSGRRRRSGGPR